ncbi:hypothetical protein EDB83DRAFT_2324385 [Lactarius deliciosus]|nr:hypothetical protein EDB83DRAFT_2324385 [Lactarius deliciosus]
MAPNQTKPNSPNTNTRHAFTSLVSASAVSSATVRAIPTTPGIDCEVINRIRDVLDAVKEQPTAAVPIQPPPTASTTLLGDLPPLRPFTVPIPKPLITRDIGCLERLRQQDCLPASSGAFAQGANTPQWIHAEASLTQLLSPSNCSPCSVLAPWPSLSCTGSCSAILHGHYWIVVLCMAKLYGGSSAQRIKSVAHLNAPNKHRQTLQTCRLSLCPFFKAIRVCAVVGYVMVEAGEMGLRAALVWKTSAKPGAGMGAVQDCRRVWVANSDEPVLPVSLVRHFQVNFTIKTTFL